MESVQEAATKETAPTPPCDQATLPVGARPVTFALHVITVGEPAGTPPGWHETVVFVVLPVGAVTVKFAAGVWVPSLKARV